MERIFGKSGKIGLNLLGYPKRKFSIKLNVVVGGNDLSDVVDSVCEMIGDHAEELFKDITYENTK